MEGASKETGAHGRKAERSDPAAKDRDPPVPAREKAVDMDLVLFGL